MEFEQNALLNAEFGIIKRIPVFKAENKTFREHGGGRWGRFKSLGGVSNLYYVCTYVRKKKESFLVGSNHKKLRKKSSALLTTLSGHIRERHIVRITRNPLDLKSEVRIQETDKKIKMSKSVDFLKNPR